MTIKHTRSDDLLLQSGEGRAKQADDLRARNSGSTWSTQCALILSVTLCVLLSACGSARADLEVAKQAVEQFHLKLDSEQYAGIYAASHEGMRSTISETDFTTYLEKVHEKLGTVKSSSMLRAGVAWHSSQRATITLIYETTFTSGNAKEQFIWQIDNNRAFLYRYVVNSE